MTGHWQFGLCHLEEPNNRKAAERGLKKLTDVMQKKYKIKFCSCGRVAQSVRALDS